MGVLVFVAVFVRVGVKVLVEVLVPVLVRVGVKVGVLVGTMGVLVFVAVFVRVGVKVAVLVLVNVAVKIEAEGVAVGGRGAPARQTLSIQYPKVAGFPIVSHWSERTSVRAVAMEMPLGGHVLGPQSEHSKAALTLVTCCHTLGAVTAKLNPY
jgi:hypothetical protein